MKKDKMAIIIHPGTQHAWQLANAVHLSGVFSSVHFYTGLVFRPGTVPPGAAFLNRRIRPVLPGIEIHRIWPLALGYHIVKKLQKLFGSGGISTDYIFQYLFALLLLPIVYRRRQQSFIFFFETCGWPLCWFAGKWDVPFIFDFASIGHDEASRRGIRENRLGKRIKTSELRMTRYAFFCSHKAAGTYNGIPPGCLRFILHPGHIPGPASTDERHCEDDLLTIVVIANTAYRKGIDLALLAFSRLTIAKRLFIIGSVPKRWIIEFCRTHEINRNHIHSTGNLSRERLNQLLVREKVQVHLLASRGDSYGLVVPETMSMGIINIVSPLAGVTELLTHKYDALILNELNTREITASIDQYLALTTAEKCALARNSIATASKLSVDNYYRSVKYAISQIITKEF